MKGSAIFTGLVLLSTTLAVGCSTDTAAPVGGGGNQQLDPSDLVKPEEGKADASYLGVLGNQRLITFPTWELRIDHRPEGQPLIATEKVKWDLDYQERRGVEHGPANLAPEFEAKVHKLARRIYRLLGLSGYARIDFRLHEDGRLFFLEANPNPQISDDEEFAHAAGAYGFSYPELLEKVISLGIRRAKQW